MLSPQLEYLHKYNGIFILKQTPGLLKYYNPKYTLKLLETGIEPYNLSAPDHLGLY